MGKSLTNNTCQIVLVQPKAYEMEKKKNISSYIKRNISALFQRETTAISLHILCFFMLSLSYFLIFNNPVLS